MRLPSKVSPDYRGVWNDRKHFRNAAENAAAAAVPRGQTRHLPWSTPGVRLTRIELAVGTADAAVASHDPLIRPENQMLHYSCDLCKRMIDPHTDLRHVVKIEVFAAIEDQPCCSGDEALVEDADHLEDVQEMLERIEDEEMDALDDARSMRFDLCDDCRRRFVRNPLGIKSGKTLDFSQN